MILRLINLPPCVQTYSCTITNIGDFFTHLGFTFDQFFLIIAGLISVAVIIRTGSFTPIPIAFASMFMLFVPKTDFTTGVISNMATLVILIMAVLLAIIVLKSRHE